MYITKDEKTVVKHLFKILKTTKRKSNAMNAYLDYLILSKEIRKRIKKALLFK